MNKNELFRIKLYDDFIKLRDKLNLSPMQKRNFCYAIQRATFSYTNLYEITY